MTISVTHEELQNYQNDVRNWSDARASVTERLLRSNIESDPMSFGRRTGITPESVAAELRKWETAHPFPRLIPPV